MMADAFGLDSDVYFGDAEKPLPDWRKDAAHETDDDNEDEPQPGVAEMLGFDPEELDDGASQFSADWDEEKHPRDSEGRFSHTSYHATDTRSAKELATNGIDEAMLNRRDAGYFGAGFYASLKPQNFYGKSIVAISLKHGSKVLRVGDLRPSAPEPWQDEFSAWLKKGIAKRHPDWPSEKINSEIAVVTPGSPSFNHIEYLQEVGRFARSNGYDAAEFANGQETVVFNKAAIAKIKHLGGLKSAQKHYEAIQRAEEGTEQFSIADQPLKSRSKTAEKKDAAVEAATPLAAAIQRRLYQLLKKN